MNSTHEGVIERRPIAFPDFDKRFSTEPRTLPVSGRPVPLPEDKPVFSRASGRLLNQESVSIGAPPKTRKTRGRKGRRPSIEPSPVAISPCLDGGAHRWHSKGTQARCAKCRRAVTKSLIPNLRLAREDRERVVLADPRSVKACTAPKHQWMKDGFTRGKARARCWLCKVTTERIEVAK